MALSHPKDAGKSKSRFFDKNLSHVILTVKGAAENRSSFAVGGLRGPRRHLQLSERSELSSQSPL